MMNQLLVLQLLAVFYVVLGIGLWAFASFSSKIDILISWWFKGIAAVLLLVGIPWAYFVFF